MLAPLLAFFSGAPALVYEIVWTREVALVAGGQVEAISLVLAVFFGGLALGSHLLAPRADRSPAPLRLYAGLELAAAAGACLSLFALRALSRAAASDVVLLAACCALILPITFALGGTLPALLRAVAREPARAAAWSGWIVGANTGGAVAGVGIALLATPVIGLRATLLAGAALAVCVAALAFGMASKRAAAAPEHAPRPASDRPARGVIAIAALAGVATIGFEVLSARMASLRLGSSLLAWALVLGLFLLAIAAGNVVASSRAARSRSPERDLAWIEIAAACALAVGAAALMPPLTLSATGPTPAALLTVCVATLPPALLMGAAFPYFVRLGLGGTHLASGFGTVAAANTAGGIAGALAAPYLLLPWLGPERGALACAALNAAIGFWLLARVPTGRARALLVAGLATLGALTFALRDSPVEGNTRVLFVAHGRQASAVVTHAGGVRTLIVDGDPEAASGGDARRTEELLAVLPLVLHPAPESFLEVGLGSGITLATATRFGLERIECVEIADSVIRASALFVPDNANVAESGAAQLVHGDARVHLRRRSGAFDIVAANTVQPWSVGATGLYSLEYFERLRGALRPGGLAVQWLPVDGLDARSFAAILRTFFEVFEHGGLWWSANNVFVLGSEVALPVWDDQRAAARLALAGLTAQRLGLSAPAEIPRRWIGSAADARRGVGSGELLSDDRPALEARGARGRQLAAGSARGDIARLLARIADADASGAANGAADRGAIAGWLRSIALRGHDDTEADRLEARARAAGLDWVAQARAARLASAGASSLSRGRLRAAQQSFEAARRADPTSRQALLGLAQASLARGEASSSLRWLDEALELDPRDAGILNQRAAVLDSMGRRSAARDSLNRALEADPFFPGALANAGLLALEGGDLEGSRRLLERLEAVSPLGETPELVMLRAALARRSPDTED